MEVGSRWKQNKMIASLCSLHSVQYLLPTKLLFVCIVVAVTMSFLNNVLSSCCFFLFIFFLSNSDTASSFVLSRAIPRTPQRHPFVILHRLVLHSFFCGYFSLCVFPFIGGLYYYLFLQGVCVLFCQRYLSFSFFSSYLIQHRPKEVSSMLSRKVTRTKDLLRRIIYDG